MPLLEFHHELFSRTGVYAAPNGASDLPNSGGVFAPGDLVINLNPAAGGPAMWQCMLASPAPTFAAIAFSSGRATRTTAVNTTATTADRFLFVTAVSTVTLPAAANWPAGQQLTIKNTSAGNVTVTPASGTINGAANITIAAGLQADLTTDGTNWFTVGS
jgi:hypothetical protein